jgi:CheY-like chemotaxis protein
MSQKVLVVDDDPIMHRVLRHYLERGGYEILIAANGRKAIEMASSLHPDLILLDVRMPEMGGLPALRELKETPSTKAIPVIIVTVHADRTTHVESELCGAAAFLAKPFRPAELLATIQRLLPPQNKQHDEPKGSSPQL